MIYDIFISYRRNGGFFVANHLNDLLVRDGYTVSFDIDTLREGDFDEALLKRIEQCRDFLVIVDEHAFERMVNPTSDYDPEKDWMRKEIAYALRLKKNIVSVFLPEASYPRNMPDDLDKLDVKNGPLYSFEYFGKFYEKLKEFLHSTPINMHNPNQDYLGVKAASGFAYLKVKIDLDCVLIVDGDEQTTLKAGRIKKIPLAEGEYELEFVSVENESDRLEKTLEMPSKDVVLHLSLAEKRKQRIEKEAAEQEAKRKAFLQDKTISVNGVSFVMKPIEGGTFQMGAQKSDNSSGNYDDEAFDNEKPVHEVKVDSFYMGEIVATQALWKAVMGSEPTYNDGWEDKYGKGDNYPAYRVSYNDIVNDFIPKLNRLTGKNFRLPTEAEWEYAARGGNKSNGYRYGGSDSVEDVAWCWEKSGRKAHPVKSCQPNELDLYDISGNVWEWCQDWYGNYSCASQDNPTGPSKGSKRVLRGGSWCCYTRYCRVSIRESDDPSYRIYSTGFRLVLPQ